MDLKKMFSAVLLTIILLTTQIGFAVADPGRRGATNEFVVMPAKLSLTAKPGETVSQIIRVPITILMADGTTRSGYDDITFTLTNMPQGSNRDSNGTLEFLAPTTTYYASCSADLNNSHGNYRGQTNYHYDWTTVWDDSTTTLVHSGISPWVTNGVIHVSGGSGSTAGATASGGFKKQVLWWWVYESHRIDFTVYANGNCTATGLIS